MRLYTACGTPFEVDDEDLPLLAGASFSLKGEYVAAWRDGKLQYLHKMLLADVIGEVDHIDRDKMNNRRSNLVPATHSQNMHNRAPWGQYPKGITFDENKGLFRARIQKDGKRLGLGRYKDINDAIRAYNKAAIDLYGDYACINGDHYG